MNTEQLANQHFLEYEARRKHLDELFERAEKGVVKASNHLEISTQLEELRAERKKIEQEMADYREDQQHHSDAEDLKNYGPMILWQEVAERLEKLVQRIEH